MNAVKTHKPKKSGRPPLPPGQRRDSSLSMRTYSDVSDKAKRIGTAAIEALIRDAPEPAL